MQADSTQENTGTFSSRHLTLLHTHNALGLGHTGNPVTTLQSVSLALGIEDDPGQNDGPSESAKLCYPAGLTARGACLYIAEDPSEIQGTIRMACSIEGLARFQSTWREIAEGMRLVSKRVRSSDPDHAAKVRERTLVS